MRRQPLAVGKQRRLGLSAACCLLPAVFSFGCVSRTTGLRFSSTLSGQQYGQPFKRAYFNHSEQGDYDIILVDDGFKAGKASQTGPLKPVPVVSLNQFIHLHVLWKPLHGNKVDAPSTTNALIDWYVRTNEFVDEPARLHYRGAGYVSVYDGSDIARFVVRGAKLDLVDNSPSANDPMGSTTLSGSFKALKDPSLVSTLMAAQQKDVAAATSSPDPLNGPPPRPPTP